LKKLLEGVQVAPCDPGQLVGSNLQRSQDLQDEVTERKLHTPPSGVTVKAYALVGKVGSVGESWRYQATPNPQVLLKFVSSLVVTKLGIGLYLVYGIQGDDVGFVEGFLRSYPKFSR
jgi:hypothetical protein